METSKKILQNTIQSKKNRSNIFFSEKNEFLGLTLKDNKIHIVEEFYVIELL